MRLAFAGTPEFARVALAALHGAGFEIALVLTQPDRPRGRGLQLQASPVKQFALDHALPVAQPRSLREDGPFAADAADARAALAAVQPEVTVVAAYGLILPRWALDAPRLGCINIHASLLPRWRGAAPIHRAIEAGDTHTGVTIMQMDEGLDTGAMLLAAPETIRPDDTTGRLHDRLAALGGRLIAIALADACRGVWQPVAQPDHGVTYARKIDKQEAAIDWAAPADVIERRLRAFDPAPGAHTLLGAEAVKCWRGELAAGPGRPGEVVMANASGITVACGSGALRLTELQRAGGRRLAASEFLRGKPVALGTRLGEPAG